MIRRIGYSFLALSILQLGCAGLPRPVVSRLSLCNANGIVLVADGAGGGQQASNAIAAATDELRLPLHVRSFDWTHGQGQGIADVLDVAHARCQGRLLAAEVSRYNTLNPGAPISLVGYSAGSAVTLAAAEHLPPDTLERIVLLAPAVSASYDLRQALAAARKGLDAFTSERDRFYLGLGTDLIGTSDGKRDSAAGRVGFCPPKLTKSELWLAGRLRQHPWDQSAAWTGNDGSHEGTLQPLYLRSYVLPLLMPLNSGLSRGKPGL